MCWHSHISVSNPCLSGPAQTHEKKKEKVYPKDVCQSVTPLPVIPGTVGSAWGTIEAAEQPPLGLETVGLLRCIVSTLPIYGAFLILFHIHTHTFSSLSLGLFHRALWRSLMRGKNTTAMKSPRLLRAFFSKLALSSPPERFLQIPVWGIVNTNFSLLKSPHIPAMLSFEWRTQGRPLNSFIVGFKTLHFKKYKSYSQMNEGERGDWREGLLMCPVGRHELNPSPKAAQIHSPARRLPLSSRPSSTRCTHSLPLNLLLNTRLHTKTQHEALRRFSFAWQWEMPYLHRGQTFLTSTL